MAAGKQGGESEVDHVSGAEVGKSHFCANFIELVDCFVYSPDIKWGACMQGEVWLAHKKASRFLAAGFRSY